MGKIFGDIFDKEIFTHAEFFEMRLKKVKFHSNDSYDKETDSEYTKPSDNISQN